MSVYLSPGVYAREIDLSLYIPSLSTTALGLVGLATKGPIDVPTYISDPVQFASQFGDPNTEFYGQYAALQFLHTGRQLWFVRVSETESDPDLVTPTNPYAAKFATALLYENSTVARVATTSNAPVTLTATTNKLTFIIDNVGPGFTVSFPVSGSSTKYSVPGIIATLNDNSTFSKYLFASTNISGYLLIERKLGGATRSFKLDPSTSTAKSVLKFPTAFQSGTAVVGTGTATDRAFIVSSTPAVASTGDIKLLIGTDNTVDGIPVLQEIVTINGAQEGQLAHKHIYPTKVYFTTDDLVQHGPFESNISGSEATLAWPQDTITATIDPQQDPSGPGPTAITGTYSDTTAGNLRFHVKITSVDTNPVADTFAWKLVDDLNYSADIDITGASQAIGATGLFITFASPNGHTLDDVWEFTLITSVRVDTSSGGVYVDGQLAPGDYTVDYAYGNIEIVLSATDMDGIISDLNTVFDVNSYPLTASIMYEGVTLPASAPRLLISFNDSEDPLIATSVKALQIGEPVVNDITATVFGANPIFNGTAAALPGSAIVSPVAAEVLAITATSQGTWANKVAIAVETVDSVNNTFSLSVYEKGFVVERYKGLVKTPLTLPDPVDPAATLPNPSYVENAINGVSPRITVVNTVISEGVYSTLLPDSTFLLPNVGLSGGSDGAPPADSLNPSIYIGIADGYRKTGLQLFRNPEELDVNLLAVPGVYDPSVINEEIDICTTRADCMAIIDPPINYTPQQVVTWRNGANTVLAGGVILQSEHQAFNSSYAALYWPWLQIYDPVNAQTVWTPPSGHVANVYAYTDYTTETWFAPAGLTRGRLATPIKAEYNPTLGERDLLYSNSINPIATFVRDGINVWGQKTLQTKPTALDRVNVRRLMLYLEKVISTAARVLLFEPDDEVTWRRFKSVVEPYLDSVVAHRGIVEYKVRCDSTTNTPDVRDRNEMVGIIYIKPTKAVEFLQIDFVLTAQGATFEELVY